MIGRPLVLRPLHVLAAVSAGMLLVYASSVPVLDIDLWWHRRIGLEIVQTRSVTSLGDAWAPFGDADWSTTQWLAEVAYAVLYELGGFAAITGLRLLAIFVLGLVLVHTVLRGQPALVAAPVYAVTLFGLAVFVIQDRPQTLAIVGAAVFGQWVALAVARRPPPPTWMVAGTTWLWANIHGSWVLAPAVLGLAVVALLADGARHSARVWGLRAIVAGLAGLLTPAGLSTATALIRFSERTTFLGEWNPVEPVQGYAIPLALLMGLVLVSWARTFASDRSEVIVVLGLSVFAFTVNRNIPFGLVLLAPLSVTIGRRLMRESPRSPERRVRLVSTVIGVTVVAAVVATVGVHASVDPTSRAEPRAIGEWLGSRAEPVRVLNTYEAAGVLLEFSDGNVELGIDGRADRYDPDYVAAYFGAVDALTDVDGLLSVVEPDVAVLRTDEALSTHLVHRGWDVVLRDGRYVLLAPTGTDLA